MQSKCLHQQKQGWFSICKSIIVISHKNRLNGFSGLLTKIEYNTLRAMEEALSESALLTWVQQSQGLLHCLSPIGVTKPSLEEAQDCQSLPQAFRYDC